METITHSAAETEELGRQIAGSFLGKRFFMALYGDLGAGKTVFVRGLASVLSPGSRVKSPTFTLVNEYRRGPVPLFHFDFYRLESPDDFDGLGFEEYLENGACVAEWSEHLAELPRDAILVRIDKLDGDARRITVTEENR